MEKQTWISMEPEADFYVCTRSAGGTGVIKLGGKYWTKAMAKYHIKNLLKKDNNMKYFIVKETKKRKIL